MALKFSVLIGTWVILDYIVAKSYLTFATPWTVACQAPLTMRLSRQAYWSDLPFFSPGNFPGPGIEPRSPALQADSLPTKLSGKPLFSSSFTYSLFFVLFFYLNEKKKCEKL